MSNIKKKGTSINPIISQEAIQKIKDEIRSWYGSLSVKEIVCNKALITEIEKLERLLAGQVVAT